MALAAVIVGLIVAAIVVFAAFAAVAIRESEGWDE
jgi:hypothetical protein